MNKKELIIKTWNVSQKTTLDKQTKTPEFIVDEIIKCKDDRADIIVLTEFFKLGNWKKIVEKFEAEKFDVRYNLKEPMEGYNQILIAVKKETIKIIDDMDVMENDYNVMPNYLRLDIEHNNTPLTIIGVRIRKGSNSDKKRQFTKLLDKYVPNHKNPIIIIGDFNPCISRKRFNELPKISCKTWSYSWIKSKLKDFEFDIKVPSKGHSWVWSRSPKLFINDCIAYKDAKKVDILDLDYSWDFLNYEYYKNKGIKEDSVKAHNNCYPDHAILTAKVLTK